MTTRGRPRRARTPSSTHLCKDAPPVPRIPSSTHLCKDAPPVLRHRTAARLREVYLVSHKQDGDALRGVRTHFLPAKADANASATVYTMNGVLH